MDESDQRHIARDSLFVLADMRLSGSEGMHRIKVRNLSSGGMMGEGSVRVTRGSSVSVNIRNTGWVDGTVAWVQENRFGVAFREEIDVQAARASNAVSDQPPTHINTFHNQLVAKTSSRGNGILRKV
jgi:hypothetical protein